MMKCEGITSMDTEIIHIDLEPSFSDHVWENMVHKGLKCGRSIAEAKEYDCEFIKTKGCDECCFPLVWFLDPNIVIPLVNVKLSEVDRVLHIIDEFGDERELIGIVDIMGI